ncbi:MAG: NADAR family protein [Candidatus Babeliaceae bacterium]|jgi:hypothetical protein
MNVNYILLFFSFYSAQAYVHVIPLSYNAATQNYSVLLGRGKNENFWSDFKITPKPGRSLEAEANRTLFYQTNQVYNVQFTQTTPHINLPNGEKAYYITINFIPGKKLYNTARNEFKDDFAWVPITDILQNPNLTRASHKALLPIGKQTRELLTNHWSTIVPQLQVSSSPLWFNIPNAIYFYNKGQDYYEFTNFQENYPVDPNNTGTWWPTTEHYYQAQKFINYPAIQEEIRKLPSARDAFNKARDYKKFVRSDWQSVNLGIMHTAIKDKFTRYPQLKKILLDTQNRVLVENAGPHDNFFGAGADGRGENHLGIILMSIREELQLTELSHDLFVLSNTIEAS